MSAAEDVDLVALLERADGSCERLRGDADDAVARRVTRAHGVTLGAPLAARLEAERARRRRAFAVLRFAAAASSSAATAASPRSPQGPQRRPHFDTAAEHVTTEHRGCAPASAARMPAPRRQS